MSEKRRNVILLGFCRILWPKFIAETLVIARSEDVVLAVQCRGVNCDSSLQLLFAWYLEALFSNGSYWHLSDEEMQVFTEGRCL